MITSLAGQAAAARLLKKEFHHEGTGKDLKDFLYLATELYSDQKVIDTYFAYIIEEARFFVSIPRNWRAIKRIAQKLINKKTVAGKQCREIYESSRFK